MAVIQTASGLEPFATSPTVELAEAWPSGPDPDEHLWRSLGEIGTRNMNAALRQRAVEMCASLAESNALGVRITNLNRDFVTGDGIPYTVRNPNVEDVLGDFWDDDDNNLSWRLHDFARELGMYGELVLEVFVGSISGVVKLGYIDPMQIKDVDHLEGNPLILDQIRIRKKGAGYRGKELPIVRRRQGRLEGDVLFFKVNSVSNATRGLPDLLHVADWLDSYDQLLYEMVERARLIRSFIWDVTIKGADKQQLKEWTQNHRATPKSGTVRVHNEDETWDAVAPQLGSYEAAKETGVISQQIAAGTGTPRTWLSDSEDVNRSVAREMGTPTIRQFAFRQNYYVSQVLRGIVRFVLAKAEEAGRLRTTDGKIQVYDEEGRPSDKLVVPDKVVDFHPPEISPRDVTNAGGMLTNVVNALAIAEERGWFGKESIRQVIAKTLGRVGYEIDPSTMALPAGEDEEAGGGEQESIEGSASGREQVAV